MHFSALFIQRPVATTLLTIAIALLGVVAFNQLPVAALPQVDFPTISVSAQLPGANAETMASTVATPLERALGRIAGVTEMTSSSGQGNTRITLQFDLNRDVDGAARDVQAAINAATSLLPNNLPNRPTWRRDNPSDSPILVLTLTSTSHSRGEMYDLATTVLAQKLGQNPGVGQVQVGGSALPAVRVEVNPLALSHYGIGLDDIRQTITQTNVTRPTGALEVGAQRWQLNTNDEAKTAAEYLPLIVSYRNGAAVRIGDVATVEDSIENLRNSGIRNQEPAVLIILRKQPTANVVETVAQLKAMLPSLRAALPEGIELSVMVDRSLSIKASINEVENSLLIAVGLVIAVVLLFLRSWRATLIPIVAVPVSLIGSFTVLYSLGYSVNLLSMMALTVATGFVVDDAIVVLENASRHIEKGIVPYKAALLAAQEVSFTVVAMSLSLVAVFLPILLMDGVVGRLFREFAVTLSVAVLISLVISLTTTPMLCARWLRAEQPRSSGISHAIGVGFERLQAGYAVSLRWALRHGRWIMLLLFAVIALNGYLYSVIEKGFFPTQDGGRMMGSIQADQSTSIWALQTKLVEFAKVIQADPAVANVVGFTDSQQNSNSAEMIVVLKPHDERDPIEAVNERLRQSLKRLPGANLYLRPIQELRIGGRPSSALYDYTLQSDDLSLLRQWMPKVISAFNKLPELKDVNTAQQDKGQQIELTIDRERAAFYGISQALIDTTLGNAFSQRQVSVIYNPLNQYRVVLELAPEYWQNPEALEHIYLSVPAKTARNGDTTRPRQVPLSAIARFAPTNTPLNVAHQGQFAAVTVSFNLKEGVALSAATESIEQAIRELGMPTTVQGSFQGSAKAFKESAKAQPLLVLAAIVAIYIVLGILYESLIHPLTILSTIPSAGVGALLALMACGKEFSIIALIGVLLLIGIVKKNAIMMIDFALMAQRQQQLSAQEAIYQAGVMRFRPILMTSLAALFGALPLALASGWGSELRQPLGIAIVGGLLLSQLLTLYTTPLVYLYLDRLSNTLTRLFHRPSPHPSV